MNTVYHLPLTANAAGLGHVAGAGDADAGASERIPEKMLDVRVTDIDPYDRNPRRPATRNTMTLN